MLKMFAVWMASHVSPSSGPPPAPPPPDVDEVALELDAEPPPIPDAALLDALAEPLPDDAPLFDPLAERGGSVVQSRGIGRPTDPHGAGI